MGLPVSASSESETAGFYSGHTTNNVDSDLDL